MLFPHLPPRIRVNYCTCHAENAGSRTNYRVFFPPFELNVAVSLVAGVPEVEHARCATVYQVIFIKSVPIVGTELRAYANF